LWAVWAVAILLLWRGCSVARAADAQAPRPESPGRLRAGAHAIDITPTKFPVIVNGGFLERTASTVHDPLHARCLVLDDGATRMAIVVVDSCMMPRPLVDRAKALAAKATGIRPERMMISATHTHTAPSVMGALGTGADLDYAKALPALIAKGIELAAGKLAPARVGWAVAEDYEHVACRRWLRRPDRPDVDPFGLKTVGAMMHPGHNNPAYVGPAGPVDPDISMLSVQSADGRPLALLANYSMHYVGSQAVSADYFAVFASKFAGLIGADKLDPPFVAMMSQGTSGDTWLRDYGAPVKPRPDCEAYGDAVARRAHEAYKTITYSDRAPLAMSEKTLTLSRRLPDAKRLAWARKLAAAAKGRPPKSRPEVYALEQLHLRAEPKRELKLQAVRIGEFGITAIPCEVYAVTGLKIKARSPLRATMNITLANGSEGYIPPPEQHALGGYTTWPARTAGLEVGAEGKIVAAVVGMLADVSGRPARREVDMRGPYAKAVLASKPLAYWRMNDMNGPRATDAGGKDTGGTYEGAMAFYLRGPASDAFGGAGRINRAVHFIDGRLSATLDGLGRDYTVEMWFLNTMPTDARAVTGYLFSRGRDGAKDAPGDHLGLGGTHAAGGRLFVFNGDARNDLLAGTTRLRPGVWNHVALVRDGVKVTVYLNGKASAEVSGAMASGCGADVRQVFIGGRSDGMFNFVGKIDEVALYGRALGGAELSAHWSVGKVKAGK